MTSFAAESGHWYHANGGPCYTIEGKTGVRNTTLRDARKLNLYPSVTTITGCAAAPGLERWKAEQLLYSALTLPREIGGDLIEDCEPEADWIKRVWEDSKQQARKAAERGTEIHAAIERTYRGLSVEDCLRPFADVVIEAVSHFVSRSAKWSTEKSFAHPRGYGGKVDLYSLDCDGIVLDFKGKDNDRLASVKLYDNHFMQLAGYGQGLGFDNPLCGVVFFGRQRPEARVLMMSQQQREGGLAMFNALLQYWQAKTGHVPT